MSNGNHTCSAGDPQERGHKGITIWCNGQPLGATLTVEQAAAIAGCGRSSAYQAIREKRWPPAIRISERRIVICTVPFLQMLGLAIDPSPPRSQDQAENPEQKQREDGPTEKQSGVPREGTPLPEPRHDQATRDQSGITPSTQRSSHEQDYSENRQR